MTDGQPADRIAELIKNTPYQPVVTDSLPAAVMPPDASSAPAGPYSGQTVAPAEAPSAPQHVGGDAPTMPPPPEIPPHVIEHLRRQEQERQALVEQNQRLQFEKIQMSEQRFADSIAHYPLEQQQILLLQHELEQHAQVNGWQANKLAEFESQQRAAAAQSNAAQEQSAKQMVAFVKAGQAGLPFDNPAVRDTLMATRSVADMDAKVAGLRALYNVGRQEAPVFTNGGQRATATAPSGPERGSGDLRALIRSTAYTIRQ